MFSSVEFSVPDSEKLRTITDRLKSRGHSPEAFKHAQCLAGSNHIRSKSKCWKKLDDKLHKENASPKLCRGCIFSWTSDEHLNGLEDDLIRMNIEVTHLPDDTIASKHKSYEIEHLIDTIEYHKKILGINYENT